MNNKQEAVVPFLLFTGQKLYLAVEKVAWVSWSWTLPVNLGQWQNFPLSLSGTGIPLFLGLSKEGKVSERADGGGLQLEKQEMALVSLLLQTGCGRVNCWHGMPGELEGLAKAQEVVVVEEKGNRERETGRDSVASENVHVSLVKREKQRKCMSVCSVGNNLTTLSLSLSLLEKHPWVPSAFCFFCSFINAHMLAANALKI